MHVSSVSIYPLHKFNIEPTKGHIHYSQIIIFSAPFSGSMLNQGYVCKVNPSWAANFKTVAMHFLRSKQRWVIIHFETRPCAISYCWRHSIPFRPRENAGLWGHFGIHFWAKCIFFHGQVPIVFGEIQSFLGCLACLATKYALLSPMSTDPRR